MSSPAGVRVSACALLLALAGWLVACGGSVAGPAPTASVPTSPAPTPGAPTPPSSGGGSTSSPAIEHVVLVVEENHSYESVIGNGAMPYLNGLAPHYSLATQYYANTHPSIGNYFMLTTGGSITNDDSFTGTVTVNNLARMLNAAGKSWKVYAESLPSAGYLGGDAYPYVQRHNPFAYFSDIVNDPAQANKIVPFTQFATDLAAGSLPDFALVVPNILDDAHDGTLAQSDTWLSAHIGPLVNSSTFAQTLLIVVYDESIDTDSAHGGGHVAAVLAGGVVKPSYRSSTLYQHSSLLRLIAEKLSLGTAPGAAADAPQMSEFFP